MDRRALFFVMAALACAALVYPAPSDLRWVPGWLAVLYIVLAVLSFLDHLSRRATRPADRPPINRTDP